MLKSFFFLILLSGSAIAAEHIQTGEWIRARRYDYRYKTVYDIESVSRPLQHHPWIQEDCHDDGDRFANWEKSISYEVTYSGDISFDLLGFSFGFGRDRSESVSVSFQRWVHATKGLRARHTLMENFQVWKGVTIVEYRYADGSIVEGDREYDFKLGPLNLGLSVEREILEVCEP